MAMPYLADFTSKYRGQLIIDTYKKWIKSGVRVLDVGCGNGVVSAQLRDHFYIKITGCDVMNYLIKSLSFVKMDTQDKLPFANKSFDTVMFNDVLHHMPYQTQIKLVREAQRVAKRVLIFEVIPTPLGVLSDWLINKIHHPQMNIPFTFRSRQDWEKLFKKLGVDYQSEKIKTPVWYPFSHIAFNLT